MIESNNLIFSTDEVFDLRVRIFKSQIPLKVPFLFVVYNTGDTWKQPQRDQINIEVVEEQHFYFSYAIGSYLYGDRCIFVDFRNFVWLRD